MVSLLLALGCGPAAVAAPDPTLYVKDDGEIIVMVCRFGEPQRQQMQQDLPLLCLAAPADEEVLRIGPARFDELLDKAASSGAMFVVVLQPQ